MTDQIQSKLYWRMWGGLAPCKPSVVVTVHALTSAFTAQFLNINTQCHNSSRKALPCFLFIKIHE